MKIRVEGYIFTITESEVSGVYNVLDMDGLNIQSIIGTVSLSDVMYFLRNYISIPQKK